MKTLKEQARDYVWHNYGEGDFNEHNWDRSAEEVWLAGYEACRNHIHLHWKEEWKDLYKRIEESCLPAMDAMEGRYLRQVKELETRIAELETEIENWQHNATHGDDGL